MSANYLDVETNLLLADSSYPGTILFSNTSGDITTASPGVGVLKSEVVTNTKLKKGPASTLKGTNSNFVVSDLTVDTSLTVDTTSLKVNWSALPQAGASQFGAVKFDSATGDLIPSALNSGVGVLKPAAVTNPKLAAGAVSTLKGTNSLANVSDITLGPSLTMTATATPQLNSGISFMNGTDPTVTVPTDRPATANVLYVGIDASMWVYNGGAYKKNTPFLRLTTTVTYVIATNAGVSANQALDNLGVTIPAGRTVFFNYYLSFSVTAGSSGPHVYFPDYRSSDLILGMICGRTTNVTTSPATPLIWEVDSNNNVSINTIKTQTQSYSSSSGPASLVRTATIYYKNQGTTAVFFRPYYATEVPMSNASNYAYVCNIGSSVSYYFV
jgi:hypothetical protein